MNRVLNYRFLPSITNCIVTNSEGTTVDEHAIIPKKNNYKMIVNDKTVIIIFEDGSKGIAQCHPNDYFNLQLGHDIAYSRASIKHLESKIKHMCKTSKWDERQVIRKV